MAIDTLKVLVFSVQLEFCFIVIKVPILPVTGVVAGITALPQSPFMHVLFLVTRPAIRLGILKHHADMAFFALHQYMLSGELESRHPVVEFNFPP